LLLGKIFLKLQDPKSAADQYEAALLLDPRSIEAQIGSAKAQIAQGNLGDAVQALESMAKSNPRNPKILEALAEAYEGLGKTREAQQAATKAKELGRRSTSK
jgi:predicted Zn-dependent protease